MHPICSLVFIFIMPIALQNIGWKMYMVNASWDIVILWLIVSRLDLPAPMPLLACLLSIPCTLEHANHLPRPVIGSRPKARLWRRSTLFLTARNTPSSRTWRLSVAASRTSPSRSWRRTRLPDVDLPRNQSILFFASFFIGFCFLFFCAHIDDQIPSSQSTCCSTCLFST